MAPNGYVRSFKNESPELFVVIVRGRAIKYTAAKMQSIPMLFLDLKANIFHTPEAAMQRRSNL